MSEHSKSLSDAISRSAIKQKQVWAVSAWGVSVRPRLSNNGFLVPQIVAHDNLCAHGHVLFKIAETWKSRTDAPAYRQNLPPAFKRGQQIPLNIWYPVTCQKTVIPMFASFSKATSAPYSNKNRSSSDRPAKSFLWHSSPLLAAEPSLSHQLIAGL
jgi:hypothetical protein